jgi:hypothetical protein
MMVGSVLVVAGMLAWAVPEAGVKGFLGRVDGYLKVRKAAAEGVAALKPKAKPEEIAARETALAQAIRAKRSDAKQGDLLSEDVKPVILAVLRSEIKGRRNRDTRESIKEGNPRNEKAPGEVEPAIAVNAIYPKNAPLSTVPPSLLLRLPKLPPVLEYRFVGRTLILRDQEANLIVDFIKEAVPVP